MDRTQQILQAAKYPSDEPSDQATPHERPAAAARPDSDRRGGNRRRRTANARPRRRVVFGGRRHECGAHIRILRGGGAAPRGTRRRSALRGYGRAHDLHIRSHVRGRLWDPQAHADNQARVGGKRATPRRCGLGPADRRRPRDLCGTADVPRRDRRRHRSSGQPIGHTTRPGCLRAFRPDCRSDAGGVRRNADMVDSRHGPGTEHPSPVLPAGPAVRGGGVPPDTPGRRGGLGRTHGHLRRRRVRLPPVQVFDGTQTDLRCAGEWLHPSGGLRPLEVQRPSEPRRSLPDPDRLAGRALGRSLGLQLTIGGLRCGKPVRDHGYVRLERHRDRHRTTTRSDLRSPGLKERASDLPGIDVVGDGSHVAGAGDPGRLRAVHDAYLRTAITRQGSRPSRSWASRCF